MKIEVSVQSVNIWPELVKVYAIKYPVGSRNMNCWLVVPKYPSLFMFKWILMITVWTEGHTYILLAL